MILVGGIAIALVVLLFVCLFSDDTFTEDSKR